MKKIYLLALLTLTAFGRTHTAEFWSEGLFVTNESHLNSSLFARAFAPTGLELQPYIQMGQTTVGSSELPPDLYWASGLHWNWDVFRAFGEYRFHSQSRAVSPSEWRFLVVYGDFFEKRIERNSSLSLFFEPYAEASWTVLDQNRLSITALPRGGFRWRWNRETTSDLYLEPVFYVQRVQNLEQEVSVRPTGRLQTCKDAFCFALAASRTSHFRFLATLGGSL